MSENKSIAGFNIKLLTKKETDRSLYPFDVTYSTVILEDKDQNEVYKREYMGLHEEAKQLYEATEFVLNSIYSNDYELKKLIQSDEAIDKNLMKEKLKKIQNILDDEDYSHLGFTFLRHKLLEVLGR